MKYVPGFRVDWSCPHCSGEGGDIVECTTEREAVKLAKDMKKDRFVATVMKWNKKTRDWEPIDDTGGDIKK